MIQEANLIWRYVDTDSGLVMPWYTLPTLQWLKQQDMKSWEVFEYGAGYSTIWWKLNAYSLLSVDDNKVWAKAMDACFYNKQDDYVTLPGLMMESTRNEMGFDCIIIDGAWRKECLEYAIPHVAVGGYIIIDNWGQEDFPHTEEAEKLLEGWEKQLFKQPNHSSWVTAVFRKL